MYKGPFITACSFNFVFGIGVVDKSRILAKQCGWSSSHLSCGTANQYSGCLARPPNEWTGLEVNPEVKDFLIGFPTLKHRNMGGCLLFSSDEKSMSVGIKIKKNYCDKSSLGFIV